MRLTRFYEDFQRSIRFRFRVTSVISIALFVWNIMSLLPSYWKWWARLVFKLQFILVYKIFHPGQSLGRYPVRATESSPSCTHNLIAPWTVIKVSCPTLSRLLTEGLYGLKSLVFCTMWLMTEGGSISSKDVDRTHTVIASISRTCFGKNVWHVNRVFLQAYFAGQNPSLNYFKAWKV